jgi:LemA protein
MAHYRPAQATATQMPCGPPQPPAGRRPDGRIFAAGVSQLGLRLMVMENNALNAVVGFVVLGTIVGLVVYAVAIYNGLVRLKHAVSQAWSNIDVLLKQRHDELPKLVESCKQYKTFEAETLERIIAARSAAQQARLNGDVKGVGEAESQLRAGLGSVFAVAESYPDLKTDKTFQQLLVRISQLEEAIADRREFYNAAVNSNNVRIEQFPDALVAKQFDFGSADLLEFEEGEKSDPSIEGLFA